MVEPTAMSSRAVKASWVMICRSSRTLAKMIMIRALVCSSQPISEASPLGHFSRRPARCTPASLPATEAASRTPAARKTAAPPRSHWVRRPVLRKKTGMMASRTWSRNRSIRSRPNHDWSSTTPARKDPTMKCRPDQSPARPHSASQIRATCQRSFSGMRVISARTATAATAKPTRKAP